MTPDAARQRYAELKGLLDAGGLTQSQFASEISKLRVQDVDGAWHQVDPATGGWLLWNGASWTPAPHDPRIAGAVTSCPGCGAALREGARFCAGCGQRLGAEPDRRERRDAGAGRLARWGQRTWDVLTLGGCATMSGLWWWYSGMAETSPDYKTCITLIVLPLALILLRPLTDRLLSPVQAVLGRIPGMVRLGMGLAVPFLTANHLYALGYSQFDYMFKTVLVSTLASYAVLRRPALRRLARVGKGIQP